MTDAVTPTARKPRPDPQTIWCWRNSIVATSDVKYQTVVSLSRGGDRVFFDDGATARADALVTDPDWTCVGVETSEGCVMVGQCRKAEAEIGAFEVLRVVDRDWVYVRYESTRVVRREAQMAAARAASRPHCLKSNHSTPPAQATTVEEVDPRAEREARRREVDRVLAEDARRYPAFATARRRAVLAAIECDDHGRGRLYDGARSVGRLLDVLREYEDKRGSARLPTFAALTYAARFVESPAFTAYEGARGFP